MGVLEAMSEYKNPDDEKFAAVLDFAQASSQHLHCDVASDFIVWSYDFTLQVSTDQSECAACRKDTSDLGPEFPLETAAHHSSYP